VVLALVPEPRNSRFGLDAGVFKAFGALVLIGFGLVLMLPS
jgi:hypothetical protein